MPVAIAARGMPSYFADRGSCAIVTPPAAFTSRMPSAPSDAVPESTTAMFGGNSNWRGPVWFPINYLLIESLERYHHFYGDAFRVEYPTGTGRLLTLAEVARALSARLVSLFTRDGTTAARPCFGERLIFRRPAFADVVHFHEYFHGEDGRGLGAEHQTGWTCLVARLLEDIAAHRIASP